ncbi:L-lactate dehydrogenase B chain-like [Drosophila montana]|uniref:L-lactate dehydrogenase B chain-like n=1 Tax=Drosophila montana TaxID=40370 RepID=UPI00313B2C8F
MLPQMLTRSVHICRTRPAEGSPHGKTYCNNSPMSTFQRQYVKDIGKPSEPADKISVIGTGQVGLACCAFLIDRRLAQHLVMVDLRKEWVEAEALDFLHASSLLASPKIETCSDANCTAGSKYVIITAGTRPAGKSRLDIAKDTLKILSKLVPKLVESSPDATFVISSNPADVMTWAVRRISGLPKERCISSGCHLDSMRFRYLLAQRLGVAASEVNAFIVGEHGDSSVPVWSGVTVGGIALMRIIPNIGTDQDQDKWQQVHTDVVKGGRAVSKVKGYTNWAVSLAVVDIIQAMMTNSGRILSVGTDVQGLMGVEDSVVMSLPCILGTHGVQKVLELPLTEFEMNLFEKSTEALFGAQCALNL